MIKGVKNGNFEICFRYIHIFHSGIVGRNDFANRIWEKYMVWNAESFCVDAGGLGVQCRLDNIVFLNRPRIVLGYAKDKCEQQI